MCGIAGIFGWKGTPEEARERVNRMNDRMAHRGPDDQGVFAEENIALGHRRLAILDLSPAGHQPMYSADNDLVIVFNGEIYNFREVRELIPEVQFKTESDTEVILAAYKKWGKECVHRFNGMFAIAIWDRKQKELFIARDRMGIKPVYYYKKDNLLVFASEIRSLIASGLVPSRISESSLTDYFSYQTVHAPNTIIQDVLMLMPGHHMTVKESSCTISRYWSLTGNRSRASENKSYNEVCHDIRELLTAAVQRRLISDVPFGAFLSGGIDSSAVVGLMASVMRMPVKTFNISFDEGAFSEATYARTIAERFDTEHHEFRLTPADFLNYLPSALASLDHPSGDGPNSWVVSKITRENGVTMALSGLGGDELFAGYPVFNRTQKIAGIEWLGKLPRGSRALAGKLIAALKPGTAGDKLKEFMELESWGIEHTHPISRRTTHRNRIKGLLSVPMEADRTETIIRELLQESKAPLPLLSQVSVAEISTYMQNVLLRDTDQMSMASALEVRVPFLDYTLAEYVLGVNDKYKSPVFPKKLLVDSLNGLLPDEIVHRKKMGFTFPWEQWMRGELKSFCGDRIMSLARRPFINGKELEKRWHDFVSGQPGTRWPEIWICVVLEDWLTANQIEN